jgi:acetoin utilization protein AcuB
MFSVYGITGQVYSGSLEGISRVNALRPSRQSRPVEQEGIELGADIIPSHFAPPQTPSSPAQQRAIDAYRKSLPPEFERGPLYHAEQIMQRKVITMNADDPVLTAWRTMRQHGIHQAPVLRGDGALIGIVSERDLLTSINLSDDVIAQVLDRRVSDVMLSPVVASAPLTDIRRIARVMLEHNVSGVPILDERERLVGFISRTDMLRVMMKDPPLSLWC